MKHRHFTQAARRLTALTLALLLHMSSTPRFRPTMPPVPLSPWITPETAQSAIWPVSWLRPAMPPTAAFPETGPLKVQLRMVPPLTPAMPPTLVWLPPGATVPETFRFSTTPPG